MILYVKVGWQADNTLRGEGLILIGDDAKIVEPEVSGEKMKCLTEKLTEKT